MEFNVALLIQESFGSTRAFDLGSSGAIHHGRVRLTRVPRGVLVHFEGEVVDDMECARCLAPFGTQVPLEFEEVFQQHVDPRTGHSVEPLDDAPESFTIRDDHVIDISEAVRQYKVMAAALQPLCRPDCPGLCQECGADLSIRRCGCEPQEIDPRLAVLATLTRPAEE